MKTKSPLFRIDRLLLAALALLAAPLAQAQTTNTFTGASSQVWLTAGNWSTGIVPTNTTVVRFTNSTASGIGLNGNTTNTFYAAGFLTVSNGTVTLSNNSTTASANNSNAILRVYGWAEGGQTNLIVNESTSGNLVFTNHGTATATLGLLRFTLSSGGVINVSNSGARVSLMSLVQDFTGTTNTITKTGSGTLIIGGTNVNTFAGGVVLNAGVLQLNKSSALGAESGLGLTINGGSLDNGSGGAITLSNYVQTWGGSFSFIGTTNLNLGAGAVNLTGVRTVTVTANALTVGGTITNAAGGITKAGAGTLILNGANTYGGATTLNAGTLALGNVNALQNSILDTGTAGSQVVSFTVGGANTYNLGGLQGSDDLDNNGNTLSVGSSGGNTTYAGTLSGSGALIKAGAGTLTLTSALNSYSGGTTINAGAVEITGANRLGNVNGALTINDGKLLVTTTGLSSGRSIVLGNANSTIEVASGITYTATNTSVVSGSGRLNKTGLGVLALYGTNTYSGGTVVSQGTLAGDTAGVRGAITNNATVNFVMTTNGTYSGAMTGTGALAKTGAATLTTTGINDFSGATTISAGGLFVNGTNANSAVTVSSGGLLSGSGSVSSVSVSSGGTISAGAAAGSVGTLSVASLAVAGTSTYRWEMSNVSLAAGTGYDLIASAGAFDFSSLTTFTIDIRGNWAASGFSGDSSYAWKIIDAGSLSGTFDSNQFAYTTANATGLVAQGTWTFSEANNEVFLNYTAPATTAEHWWIGGGAAGLWSDAANWSNNAVPLGDEEIFFVDAGGGSSTNDTASTLTGIVFTNGAGSFTVSGLDITNGFQGVTNLSTAAQTIENNLVLAASQNFDASAGDLTFSGTLDLSNKVLTVKGAANTAISGAISGSGSLTKEEAGTLTLSGANSYSGGTLLSAGTLLGSTTSLQGTITNYASVVFDQSTNGTYAGNMGGTGSLTKNGSGNVTLSGANSYAGGNTINGGTLTGSTASVPGAVSVASGVTFALTQSTNGTLSGLVSGSGRLVKDGSGNVTLAGANTYSGGTLVSGGTLTGDTTSLQGTITNNAAVAFSQSTNGTFGSAISGSGSVSKSGAGTLTLSGANSYNGGTTVSAGALAGDTTSLQGAIANNGTVVFSQTSAGTYNGAMSGTGALIKSGSGSVTMSGNNSFAGGTTISEGALVANDNNALGSGVVTMSAGSVVATAGKTIANSFNIGTAGVNTTNFGSTTVLAGWDFNGLTGYGTNDFKASTLAAGVSNSAGLTRGSGVGTGGSAATGGWGGTTWSSANLATAVSSNQFITFSLTADPSKVLRLGSVDPFEYRRPTSGAQNGALQYSTDGVNFTDITTSISYSSSSSSGASIAAISLSSISDVAAGTTLTFRIVNWGATQATGTWYLYDTGTDAGTNDFAISGQVGTVSSTPGSGTGTIGIGEAGIATFTGSITNNSAATLTAAANGQATFSGVVSGVGNITKSGSGTVILSGSNSYTGATTISAGTLQIGDGGTTGSIATTSGVSNESTLAYNRSDNLTVSYAISGGGSLVKLGGGTVILAGNNTYSGATTINAGTLQIGNGGASGSIGSTSGVAVTNGSALAYNRSDNLTASYAISGGGSLVKLGGGTVTLSGGNNYSGGTTVSAGALRGDVSSLQGNIANNSLVIFDQSGSGTYAGALSGAGALIKTNAGTVILTGANTQGGTTIGQGTLQIGNGSTTGSLAGAITNNGTLAYNRSDNLEQATVISGSGALSKTGAGTLTLSQANTYTGATTVSEGAIRATATAALGGTGGSTTVLSGAALELSGDLSFGAEPLTISGDGISAGGALRSISGVNTNTGFITLAANSRINSDAGSLIISTAGADANAVTGAFNLSLGGAGNFEFRDRIAIGTGMLTKDGAGVLTIISAATHSGGTTLSAGTLQIGNVAVDALGTGTLALNGGILSGNNTVTRTLTNNVTIGGNVGFGDGTATGGIALSGPVDLGSANRTLTVLNTTTLSGAVSGAGGAFTKDGAGTLILGGASSFDGGVTLNAGTLRLGNTGALGSGSLTQLDGTSRVDIDVAGTITNDMSVYFVDFLQSAELSGALTLNNATFDVGIGLTATNSGVLDGLGEVTKTGVGTLVLSGVNTYEGATSIEGGAISVSSDGNLGAVPVSATPGHLSLDGGKLLATAGFTLDANRRISLGAFGGFIEVASTQELTYGGVAEGVGRLTKLGLGTLTLSGANNYSGGTLVSAGTLSGDTTSLQGGITNNAVLEFNQATNGSFASVVSGNGSLVKSGGGILTLTAANTYGGGTLVSSGTLSGDTTSLQGTITNNAALVFDQATNGTYAGVLSGGGTFTKDGAGALTLSGANTVSGATTVNAGTLELNNGTGAALGSTASVSVASGATLLISQSNQVNNSATVSLSGGTISRGSGVSEVFGALTVSGSSILDFGSGTSGSLAFGAYTPSSLLTLNNFFGGNVLSFNSDLTGSIAVGTYDTTSFLSGDGLFQINSISGGFTTSYSGGTFTITAIPEPSTYAAAIGLLGLMLWPSRKRLLKDVKSVLGLRAPMRDRLARRGELRAEG